MKVFAINNALNQKQSSGIEKYHSTANSDANSRVAPSNYDCSIPFYPLLPVSSSKPVSFGISLPFKHGYTCPCCGIKMIDPSNIHLPKSMDSLGAEAILNLIEKANPKMRHKERGILENLKFLSKENPGESYDNLLKEIKYPPIVFLKYKDTIIKSSTKVYTKKLIDYLSRYQDSMHNIEKSVFLKVKELNKFYPEDSMRELILKMRPENLKVLQQDQLKVFDRIESLSNALSPASKARIMQLISEEKNMAFRETNDTDPFKRKKFLKILTEVTAKFPKSDRKVAKAIVDSASFIPKSGDSESAFIVKYSGYAEKKNDPNKTKVLRTSEEIAIRFISSSFATFEHIFPKSPMIGVKGPKGPTEFWNGIEECAACNNNRQSNPFYEYIPNVHPEMPKNAQIHMDEVIRDINAGKYPEHKNWPYEVAPTLEQASKGLIKLDLSALRYKRQNIKFVLPENFKIISNKNNYK